MTVSIDATSLGNGSRPLFLASVQSAGEATTALRHGAEIIDAKNPSAGALGAVSSSVLAAIRRVVPRDVIVSATIGDLPCDADAVTKAVDATLAAGANFAKIGLFDGDLRGTIAALGSVPHRRGRTIGVFLADLDLNIDLSLIPAMGDAGFAGVMLDTASKSGLPLTGVMPLSAIDGYLRHARANGLSAGLAGSLRVSDVPALVALRPDLLGFRGALCDATGRGGALVAANVERVAREIAIARQAAIGAAAAAAE